jgi:ABC-type transport system involved in cytochrome c biogenesis permease component
MPPAWLTPTLLFAVEFFVDGLGGVISFLAFALLGGLFAGGGVVAVVYISASLRNAWCW